MTELRELPSPAADAVLRVLRRFAGGRTRVRALGLFERLATKLGVTRVDVSESIRELHRLGLLRYAADVQGLPVSGYVEVTQAHVEQSPHAVAWQKALTAAGFDEMVVATLADLSAKLPNVKEDDMGYLAKALNEISHAPASDLQDAGFNISARRLLGSSKVLSALTPGMLAALNLPKQLHEYSPRYVVCAGPADPVAVLLIENPRAFENALRSGLAQRVALVCTFGFGLAYLRADAASGMQADPAIMLPRDGNPPSLAQLLSHPRAFIAADLDRAGLDIYRSLKRSMPQLELSAVFESMLPMMSDPARSHPYAALFQKEGQAKVRHPLDQDDESTRFLLAACAQRSADQEAVPDSDWLRLGDRKFRVPR